MIEDQSIKDQDSKDRGIAVVWKYLLDWARNQSAGGGRMNWVVAGRKLGETSAIKLASAVVARIGANVAVLVLSPT
jgi:hypothetical protein